MALEIERKFLVAAEGWRPLVTRVRRLRQAYIARNERVSVRVRIEDGERAWLTIKTATPGIERQELEYPIPAAEAETLLSMREGVAIAKTRHDVPLDGVVWEIDVFEDANTGLTIAEVELDHADQPLALPDWIGVEVTHDRRYYGAELARLPFRSW